MLFFVGLLTFWWCAWAMAQVAYPTVSFSKGIYNAYESDGTVKLTVQMTQKHGEPVTVSYKASSPKSGTPATAHEDFVPVENTLVFPKDSTEAYIYVPVLIDSKTEGTEQFQVELFGQMPAGVLLGTKLTYIYLQDGNRPPPSVEFAASSYSVSESKTTVEIEVKRTPAPMDTQKVVVEYAVTGGSAEMAKDFTVTGSSVVFGPGDQTKTITLGIANDSEVELDETVVVELSAGPSGAVLGSQKTTTLTILDDDFPTPTVQFSQAEYEFIESEGTVAITLTLDFPAWKDTKVGYKIMALTATEGSDYSIKDKDGNSAPAEGEVTFLAGESQAMIFLMLTDDAAAEEAEFVQVSIVPVSAAWSDS